MKICRSLVELEEVLNNFRSTEKIGFVPTMGALHMGHISLVKNSIKHTTATVVSIFVNPTQFNNASDLENYPRDVEADFKLLEAAGASVVFVPRVIDIYPEGIDFSGVMPKTSIQGLNNGNNAPDKNYLHKKEEFDLGGLDNYGEGPRRPGHFYGVVQVVTRLFDLVKPDFAFFGEKDFQQLAIIKHITKSLNYPVEIIACPTLREDDGLAMSSRNQLLTSEQRKIAPNIYKNLLEAQRIAQQTIGNLSEYQENSSESGMTPKQLIELTSIQINSVSGLEVEYIEILNSETLQPVVKWDDAEQIQLCAAIYARPVRLIDNIKLK